VTTPTDAGSFRLDDYPVHPTPIRFTATSQPLPELVEPTIHSTAHPSRSTGLSQSLRRTSTTQPLASRGDYPDLDDQARTDYPNQGYPDHADKPSRYDTTLPNSTTHRTTHLSLPYRHPIAERDNPCRLPKPLPAYSNRLSESAPLRSD
jgi:hypothetical protein